MDTYLPGHTLPVALYRLSGALDETSRSLRKLAKQLDTRSGASRRAAADCRDLTGLSQRVLRDIGVEAWQPHVDECRSGRVERIDIALERMRCC